jgi:hypothetical protein
MPITGTIVLLKPTNLIDSINYTVESARRSSSVSNERDFMMHGNLFGWLQKADLTLVKFSLVLQAVSLTLEYLPQVRA